ncbi:MAG TPA: transcription antitermination factor NusB [Lentisphaeria bacterium]|nr:MAG: transcription antitermination factor NusB [Lentisphaerae bacterium GWF2_38_69]HBM16173.1 transcription antitermination factor NusB [Lentisphaeria bacterium]
MTNKANRETVKIHYRRHAREWVMQFLFQRDIADSLDETPVLDSFAFQLRETELYELPEKDIFKKAYKAAVKLLSGILEKLPQIDEMISRFSLKSDWPIERIDPVDKNIMRVAVYEMLYCDNVPPIVSINEAVEIGKEFGSSHSPSFINGILNSIKDSLPKIEKESAQQQ